MRSFLQARPDAGAFYVERKFQNPESASQFGGGPQPGGSDVQAIGWGSRGCAGLPIALASGCLGTRTLEDRGAWRHQCSHSGGCQAATATVLVHAGEFRLIQVGHMRARVDG